MGKGLHKVFSTVVKEILQELTSLGESGSEVSHFIPEPRNFAEVKKLSENINKREARYKIRDRVRQRQPEWKGALKATRNTGKGLHKVFSTVVKYISQELATLGESGSEVSHFIPEPRNFSEVKKLSDNINKPWLKATIKDIKNPINNQTFLIEYQN